jgi:hypothetical protein
VSRHELIPKVRSGIAPEWWWVFVDVDVWVTSLFHQLVPSLTLLEDAFRTAAHIYGENEALDWAEGFTFPEEVCGRDVSEFQFF